MRLIASQGKKFIVKPAVYDPKANLPALANSQSNSQLG
jgi:hypothetical protein